MTTVATIIAIGIVIIGAVLTLSAVVLSGRISRNEEKFDERLDHD